MPTKKISDLPKHEMCKHPDHKLPMHVVYKPGVYEHTCTGCGHKIKFIVRSEGYLHTPEIKSDWTQFDFDDVSKDLDKIFDSIGNMIDNVGNTFKKYGK